MVAVEHGGKAQVTFTGVNLERQNIRLWSAVVLCVTYTMMDVGKGISSYGLRYQNGNSFPLPQSILVTWMEGAKCLVCITIHCFQTGLIRRIQLSPLFLVPSIMYVVTNNLFLFALTYVTPAVWMVLVQNKILMTVIAYRLFFRRTVTIWQWAGAVLVTVAIAISQAHSFIDGHNHVPAIAVWLSLLNGVLSTAASICTEVLFKNDSRPFMEQQVQMYFFGTLVSFLYVLYNKDMPTLQTVSGLSGTSALLLVIVVVTTTAHGLLMASVVKNLDNMVKYYMGALANILIAMLSAILFPDKFTFDLLFLISLLVLLTAIYVYEAKWDSDCISKPVKLHQNGYSRVNVDDADDYMISLAKPVAVHQTYHLPEP